MSFLPATGENRNEGCASGPPMAPGVHINGHPVDNVCTVPTGRPLKKLDCTKHPCAEGGCAIHGSIESIGVDVRSNGAEGWATAGQVITDERTVIKVAPETFNNDPFH